MSNRSLTAALAKVNALPEADQERIGHELTRYVDDLQQLRADLDQGLASLDAGLGKEVDIEAVIAAAKQSHG
jgi:hypothetical protein